MESFFDGRIVLYNGDMLEVLKTLPADSVDSCVCDPPYHLTSIVKRFGAENAAPAKEGKTGAYARASRGFMGKVWDGGDIAFRPETWTEVLRVLKPGGHLVAFSGTRTYHRMACAIEDAGFEVRDSLMWVYGTGFPKSHDVSKGIDASLGADRTEVVGQKLFWGNNATGGRGGQLANGFAPVADGSTKTGAILAPATAAAQEWDSWGTALKPAFEPIVLARKPLSEGTVAANVLRWRTGAINIGACRVPTDAPRPARAPTGRTGNVFGAGLEGSRAIADTTEGRWPANVVLSGQNEVKEAFPNEAHRFFFNTAESDAQWLARNLSTALVSDAAECSTLSSEHVGSVLSNAVGQSTQPWVLTCTDCPAPFTTVTASALRRISDAVIETIRNTSGRCSPESLPLKHTRSDSLADVVAIRERIDTITIIVSLSKSSGFAAPVTFNITATNAERGEKGYANSSSSRVYYSSKANRAGRLGSKHPTVKPLDLMQYLVRLVTPPKGTVLDCFAGTGSTGQAALYEGMSAILIEREVEYCVDIRRRMELAMAGQQTRAAVLSKLAPDKPRAVDPNQPVFEL